MANVDKPFGLKPVRYMSGAPYNGAVTPYYVPAGYGPALFVGDAVLRTSTTNTTEVTISGDTFAIGTLTEVNRATAGDTPCPGSFITGVIVAIEVAGGTDATSYKPASTEAVVYVADDPNLIFYIQDDGVATLAVTDNGLNANLIFTDSGSTVTGLSGMQLDSGTDGPDADPSNQLRIRNLARLPNNTIGANAIWEVVITNHTEAPGSTGI